MQSGLDPRAKPSRITLIIFTLTICLWVFETCSGGMKFNSTAKESEAKTNLKQVYLSEEAYYKSHHTYAGGANAFQLIGWSPVGQNRYAYYCGDDFIPNLLPAKNAFMGFPLPDPNHWPYIVRPGADDFGFTAMAIGNIDSDAFPDLWMINQDGKPQHLLDDGYDVVLEDILVDRPFPDLPEPERKIRLWLSDQGNVFISIMGVLLIILAGFYYRDHRRYQAAFAKRPMELEILQNPGPDNWPRESR